jgi:hypothetical protein
VDGAVKNQEAGDDPRVGSAVSGPALHMIDAEQDLVVLGAGAEDAQQRLHAG